MSNELQRIEPNGGPVASGSGLLAVIDRAARDPAVDVDKMERLLALAESIHAREAKSEYDQALNNAQSEMRTISRDCHNPQTRSKYASYEAIDTAIRPIYTAHGFAMSFGSKASATPQCVIVTCRISHRAGHTEHVELEMPADGKGAKGNDVMTKTHAVGSALSYAKRYVANLVWNLSFGEADDDGNGASERRRNNPAPNYAPQHAPNTAPANVERKQAAPVNGDKVKARFLEIIQPLAKQAKAYAEEKGWLAPFDLLTDWPLERVPKTKAELEDLQRQIEAFAGTPDMPEACADPELPATSLSEKAKKIVREYELEELPADIASVVWHVPPKGVKKKDYTPETIGKLYADRHTPETANRLFGFIEHFAANGWTKDDGTKVPPSQQDLDLRAGLDKLSAWLETHKD